MRFPTIFIPWLALAVLSACGGGGGSASSGGTAATQLTFTPGSTSSGYRLARNPNSTGTTLILDLYGPAGALAQGVAFFLTADTTKVDWANAGGPAGTFSLPRGAFNLGTAPQIHADKLTGSDLQVGLFQKTGSATYADTQAIVAVALSLRSGVAKGPVALAATMGNQAMVLNSDGTTSTIPAIDLGTIQAD